jgi:hypothetical protein
MYQRFLHIAQPTKWRERMVEGALSTKFIVGHERVVSIEDDGIEDVYALRTTTGNYVVWGFASSNSGQLQQSPIPRGGGIITQDDWQIWPEFTPRPEDLQVGRDGSAYVPLPEVTHGYPGARHRPFRTQHGRLERLRCDGGLASPHDAGAV